jgi:hypothetical protein
MYRRCVCHHRRKADSAMQDVTHNIGEEVRRNIEPKWAPPAINQAGFFRQNPCWPRKTPSSRHIYNLCRAPVFGLSHICGQGLFPAVQNPSLQRHFFDQRGTLLLSQREGAGGRDDVGAGAGRDHAMLRRLGGVACADCPPLCPVRSAGAGGALRDRTARSSGAQERLADRLPS